VPFTLIDIPCLNPLFQTFLDFGFKQAIYAEYLMQHTAVEKTTLGLADGLLKTCSTVAFCEYLESSLPTLFNCERATCVLVHRKKKFLFRIIPDQSNGGIRLKQWELGTGFSGIVAVSATTLHTQKLEKDDINFVREVDDPNWDWTLRERDWPTGQHPPNQVVSVPVYTHENRANLGQ
jgi:hypothetical protein